MGLEISAITAKCHKLMEASYKMTYYVSEVSQGLIYSHNSSRPPQIPHDVAEASQGLVERHNSSRLPQILHDLTEVSQGLVERHISSRPPQILHDLTEVSQGLVYSHNSNRPPQIPHDLTEVSQGLVERHNSSRPLHNVVEASQGVVESCNGRRLPQTLPNVKNMQYESTIDCLDASDYCLSDIGNGVWQCAGKTKDNCSLDLGNGFWQCEDQIKHEPTFTKREKIEQKSVENEQCTCEYSFRKSEDICNDETVLSGMPHIFSNQHKQPAISNPIGKWNTTGTDVKCTCDTLKSEYTRTNTSVKDAVSVSKWTYNSMHPIDVHPSTNKSVHTDNIYTNISHTNTQFPSLFPLLAPLPVVPDTNGKVILNDEIWAVINAADLKRSRIYQQCDDTISSRPKRCHKKTPDYFESDLESMDDESSGCSEYYMEDDDTGDSSETDDTISEYSHVGLHRDRGVCSSLNTIQEQGNHTVSEHRDRGVCSSLNTIQEQGNCTVSEHRDTGVCPSLNTTLQEQGNHTLSEHRDTGVCPSLNTIQEQGNRTVSGHRDTGVCPSLNTIQEQSNHTVSEHRDTGVCQSLNIIQEQGNHTLSGHRDTDVCPSLNTLQEQGNHILSEHRDTGVHQILNKTIQEQGNHILSKHRNTGVCLSEQRGGRESIIRQTGDRVLIKDNLSDGRHRLTEEEKGALVEVEVKLTAGLLKHGIFVYLFHVKGDKRILKPEKRLHKTHPRAPADNLILYRNEAYCKLCNGFIRKPETLPNHLLKYHKDLCPKCSICKTIFATNSQRNEHCLTKHNMKRNVLCEICPQRFRNPGELRDHMNLHLKPNSFPCSFCGKHFNTNKHLSHHKRRCKSKSLKCEHCDFIGPTFAAILLHKSRVGSQENLCL